MRSTVRSSSKFLFWFILVIVSFKVSGSEQAGDYIHYRLGVKYKNEKKYDEAIDEFRKVLAAYPDNYNAYMHMAEIRTAQDRSRLVVYNLKKALSYNPGWGKAHKLLAKAYEKDGQLQKAIIELQSYQQSSDPAERDSLQTQIERLIMIVSGGQSSLLSDQKEDNAEKNDKPEEKDSPIVSGNAKTLIDSTKTESKKPVTKELDTKKSESKESGSAGKEDVLAKEKEKKTETVKSKPGSGADEELNKLVELYDKKQYDAALEQIKRVLTITPNHPGAYYYAGLIRRRNGQNKMAKINFLKSVNFPEQGHNAHFYLGKLYAEEKNNKEAIQHLSAYVEKTSYEPGKKEALELIEELKKGGGAQKSSAPLEKEIALPVVKPVPKESYLPFEVRIDSLLSMMAVDTLTDLGQQLISGINEFKQGNYDSAIREFKKTLAAYPKGTASVHSLYNTGVCYFKLNLYKEAESQFQQILDRFPNHSIAAQCLFIKALTYIKRDEPKVAEKLFRKFIQSYRTHEWVGKAYEELGDCYKELEEPRKAIDAYLQAGATGKNIDKVSALFKLGSSYLQIGNSKRGHDAFKSAIELGEKHDIYLRVPDCYYRIGDDLYKAKDYEGALSYYTRATRKYPAFQETPWGLFQIGSIYKNLKRYQDAINTFKDLVRKYPDDYWAKQARWKMEDAIWENEYKAVLR